MKKYFSMECTLTLCKHSFISSHSEGVGGNNYYFTENYGPDGTYRLADGSYKLLSAGFDNLVFCHNKT